MKYEFEKVVDGAAAWIGEKIFPKMNDFQEIVARMFIGRILEKESSIKDAILGNGIVRTFGIIDGDGMVEVDELLADVKKAIAQKGNLVVNIPLFGKLTFVPEDADDLYKFITSRYNR